MPHSLYAVACYLLFKKTIRLNSILENRAKSFIVDYLILCLIGVLLFAISADLITSMFVIYPIAMNKDFLNGKSIGKRIFGIQVQNLDGQIANEWKCSLRNILPIIPIDILFTLISPKRRIGDRIAQTQIGFENQKNLKSIGTELKNYQLNKELLIGIFFGTVNIYGLLNLYGFMFKIALNQ